MDKSIKILSMGKFKIQCFISALNNFSQTQTYLTVHLVNLSQSSEGPDLILLSEIMKIIVSISIYMLYFLLMKTEEIAVWLKTANNYYVYV
jgi:hypothetical protein